MFNYELKEEIRVLKIENERQKKKINELQDEIRRNDNIVYVKMKAINEWLVSELNWMSRVIEGNKTDNNKSNPYYRQGLKGDE